MNMIIKDIDAMRGLFEVSDYFLVYSRIYYGYTKVTNRFKFLSLRMEDCLRFSVESYGFFLSRLGTRNGNSQGYQSARYSDCIPVCHDKYSNIKSIPMTLIVVLYPL